GQRLVYLGIEPSRVLCSPHQRAVSTAEYAGLGQKLEITDLLREVDYGDYEGLTTEQIRSKDPRWNLFRDGCPGGETFDEAGARADELLAMVSPDAGDGDVALVGHGHFSRVIGVRYIGLPGAAAQDLFLGTASLSILGHEHEWRAVSLWNHEA